MHILITGGTGLIGAALTDHFIRRGYCISILTRRSKAGSNNRVNVINTLDPSQSYDAVINLAGEPLDKRRWNYFVKKTIYDSRIQTTQKLIDYIKQTPVKPKTLISGSAIGYYGTSIDQIFNETFQSEAPQNESLQSDVIQSEAPWNFTTKLCHDWEAAANQAQDFGVRVCCVRTGIVLSSKGGALPKMVLPFRLGVGIGGIGIGLGATLGSGQQWMSWIHLKDCVEIIDFLIHHPDLSGPFNMTAPNPVTNAVFTQTLGQVLNRSAFLTMPAAVLKIMLGEVADALLLRGQHVVPSKLINAGYYFTHPTLQTALIECLGR